MRKTLIAFLVACLCAADLSAQTLTKEAMNNFARFTQKPELSSLEKARKNIDDAYKTKKDSLSYKVNLIRGLVYSALAVADSTRKLSYVKDPIDEALYSMNRLKSPKDNYQHESEMKFIRKQLTRAWFIKARRAADQYNYQEAFKSYEWMDSLGTDKFAAKHNLAVLSERLGYSEKAIHYYSVLISDKKRALPEYYLALSNLYEQSRNSLKALSVIEEGRREFPGNRELLFKQLNTYADNGVYDMVSKHADEALEYMPTNVNLLYLAGFSSEMIGNREKAEGYYKQILSMEQNNYEGNYALGLLYLNTYLKDGRKNKEEKLLLNSKNYFLHAAEINPNAVNVLKSLEIIYTLTGNTNELSRVKNKLNQVILN